eukprot:Gb_32979 [translate_table: standard]
MKTTSVSKARGENVKSKANPLKNLSAILFHKLQSSASNSCNLNQIANEILKECKMKSDTAHRRIYDIANVYEGAGLITRSPESRPKEFGVITAHRDEFYDSAFKKEIRLRKPEIHLLTSFRSGEQLPSHKETLCGPLKRNKDRLCSLQKEKASALLRLKAKKADYDLLKDEYALAKEWILYNQKRATNKAVQKDRRDDCSNSNVENAFLHPPFTLLAAQPHTYNP